ncbi:MAG: AbrB/MazE/SpoVT family DNA-binding domain-containing protein [Verrucomicrobiota bacterium]
MTTVLARKGQVVIPKSIRDEMNLEFGDDFEVYQQDGEIILRPLAKGRNVGLANLLLNPPGALDLPEREGEIPDPLDFS